MKKQQDPKTPPKYYTLIPAEVRYSKQISPGAKILYGEILTLSAINGFCSASNQYWATLFDVDDKTVSEWIRQLVSVEFIRSDILKDYQRKLYPKYGHIKEKKLTGVSGKPETTQSGKPDNNNTSINTINNSNSEKTLANHQFSFSNYISGILQNSKESNNWTRYFAAYFLKRKGLTFDSAASVEGAMKRHYRAAKELGQFVGDMKRVSQAFYDAEHLTIRGEPVNWTLETVVKQLTK